MLGQAKAEVTEDERSQTEHECPERMKRERSRFDLRRQAV
jgi:hypothetical protein